MTDEEQAGEGVEEDIEDLEAPAATQRDVAGGVVVCRPTNNCGDDTLVTHCNLPTQKCESPTCQITQVHEI